MNKICCLMICSMAAGSVFGSDITFINSDVTEYSGNTINCKGNVIAVYGREVVSADAINYDSEKDCLIAEGNVIVKDSMSNTYLADKICVKQNFASGYAKNIKIITCDKTRLAAKRCTIRNNEYELEDVIFTPCYECTESGSLTWQLKSRNVIFNPQNYTSYKDAVIEAFDVPLLYVPYISHVSTNLKRKSGFLLPEFATSSQQGFSVLPKYLWSISDSQECIFKPILSTKLGQVAWAYYGLRFRNGEFNIDASITDTKSVEKKSGATSEEQHHIDKIRKSGYRGHIFSKLRYDVNDKFRMGFDVNLSSDRYYLKRFSFFESIPKTLETDLYAEGFDRRNYIYVKSSMFQTEHDDVAPKILPMFAHDHYFDFLSGTLSFEMLAMNLAFPESRNSQKYIMNSMWSKEFILWKGILADISFGATLQGLQVSEKRRSDYDSYFQARPVSTIKFQWPFVITYQKMETIISPILGLNAAENKKYFDVMESPFDELNIVNVFSNSKSISPYNIDSGSQYFYGANVEGYNCSKKMYKFICGRSVSLTKVLERTESSGLKYRHSNIVGELDVFLTRSLTATIDGDYSTQDKKINKIESRINYDCDRGAFGIMAFRGKQIFCDPFKVNEDLLDEEIVQKKYKGIQINLEYKISNKLKFNNYTTFGNESDDIVVLDRRNDHLKFLKNSFGITYENECAKFSFQCEKNNRRSGDLHPEIDFKILVQLKKLG